MPPGPSKPAFLRTLVALKPFDNFEIEALARAFKERQLKAGAPLYKKGDAGDACYIVHQGRFELFIERDGTNHTLTELAPGAMFGHVDLLDGGARSAFCSAKTDGRLLELSRAAFDALLQSGAPVAYRLVDVLTSQVVSQLRVANTRLTNLASEEQHSTKPRSPENDEVQTVLREVAASTDAVRLNERPPRTASITR